MTEPRQIETALRELRVAVARAVTPPPPATIRARAKRHIPRQVITGLVAAAAVAAVLVGAIAVVRDTASAPPPGGEPTPTVSPLVRPIKPIPSRPTVTIEDPIARTDWANATITVLPHPDSVANCPSGQLRLRDGASSGWPRLTLPEAGGRPVYGDLTQDGRPDAVLYAECLLSVEDSGDGDGQLLVVTRETDGTLRALAWIGQRGALYPEFWTSDGTLFVDAHPWHVDWGYSLGAVLAYRWQDGGLALVDSGYPGLQEVAGNPAPAVDLRPVAGWLGCPGAVIRLDPGGTTATRDGYVYDLTPTFQPSDVPQWPDLDGTGDRYLVVAVACLPGQGRLGGPQFYGQGLLVLTRAGDAYTAIDLVPVDPMYSIGRWTFAGAQVTIERYERDSGELVPPDVWYWNGTNFQP